MKHSDPLEHWTGSFGAEYIERNSLDAPTQKEAEAVFARALDASGVRTNIESVLEVGANIGINLAALRTVLPKGARVSALEPNPAACKRLRGDASLALAEVLETDAYKIPAPDAHYDLVFTKGVLIHIPPARLEQAMREIVRVSRRYVLCAEYFSHTPEEVPYRGNTGMLWKRDFGAEYLRLYPKLRTRAYGFLWQHEFPHFDNLNWWMFEKGEG
jgi:pseudaminic acid biosynthesis-associated methylase